MLCAGAMAFCTVLVLQRTARKKAFCLILLAAVLSAVALRMGFDRWVYAPAAALVGEEWEMEVELSTYAEGRAGYGFAEGEVRAVNGTALFRPIKALIYLEDASPDFLPGDRLSGRFLVAVPAATADFDATSYYKGRSVYVTLSQRDDISLNRPGDIPLRYLPYRIGWRLKENLRSLMPGQAGHWAVALITGDKSGFTASERESLAVSGLSHMVAVSGMHLSMLAGALLLLFGKRMGGLLSIPLLLLYMAMTGFPASVVRAGIMNFMALGAFFLRRDGDALTSLSLALFVILFLNPYAVNDAGCALSFAATAGILLLGPPIKQAVARPLNALPEKLRKPISALAMIVISSFCSSVATLPLTALFFGGASVLAPVFNAVALPLMTVAFLGAGLSGVLGFVWMPLAAVAASVASPLLSLLAAVVQGLARFPFASVPADRVFYLSALFFCYGMAALALLFPRRFPASDVARCCVLLALTAFCMESWLSLHEAQLVVLSAEGPATALIEDGRCVLVDCGPVGRRADTAEALDFLWDKGLKAELLFVTSVEEAHAGAAPLLLRSGRVEKLALPPPGEGTDLELYREILEAAAESATPVSLSAKGVWMDGVGVAVLPLTDSQRAAAVVTDGMSALLAHCDNLFLVAKALPDHERFDVLMVDGETLTNSASLHLLARRTDAELIVVPEGLFGETARLDWPLLRLDRAGDMTIRFWY